MSYSFHPEAAAEYAEQVAFYKSIRPELGKRYSQTVKQVLGEVCQMPRRYRSVCTPDICLAKVQGFPCDIIFREANGSIQVLAIAHHRRRPHYWLGRVL